MKEKKIPRAIKQSLLEKLKKIDPDINKAIESLMNANLCESERVPDIKKTIEPGMTKEEAMKLWPWYKKHVEAIVDQAIEDAKRGYK
jgi:hypothetical protein